MQNKQTHWASILSLIIIGTGIVLIGAITVFMAVKSFINLVKDVGDPAGNMIGAAAYGFITFVLIASFWFVLQKTRGLASADFSFRFPFASWQVFAGIGVLAFSIVVGGAVSLAEIHWLSLLILPPLTILVIVIPIWLMYGLGSRGIEAGPRWKFFATLGLSLTAGPLIMIVLELVLLVVVIVLAAIYFGVTNPALLDHLRIVAEKIRTETNQEALLDMVAPYLTNPAILISGFVYVSILVPMIEETFKPLGVWVFGKSIESSAQGFVLGALGGAAFAMIESLNASADGSSSWAIIAGVRAGTSILHMLSSGITGWGIASAFKEKRYGRLIAAYLTAICIHGVWNAAAAGTSIAALGESIGKPEWVYRYTPAFIMGLLVMILGVIRVLLLANKKLRSEITPAHDEEEKVESAA